MNFSIQPSTNHTVAYPTQDQLDPDLLESTTPAWTWARRAVAMGLLSVASTQMACDRVSSMGVQAVDDTAPVADTLSCEEAVDMVVEVLYTVSFSDGGEARQVWDPDMQSLGQARPMVRDGEEVLLLGVADDLDLQRAWLEDPLSTCAVTAWEQSCDTVWCEEEPAAEVCARLLEVPCGMNGADTSDGAARLAAEL